MATPSLWNQLNSGTINLDTPLVADAAAEIDQAWYKHFKDPTLERCSLYSSGSSAGAEPIQLQGIGFGDRVLERIRHR